MLNFYSSWGIGALVLLLLAVWAGRRATFAALGKPSNLGILIDARGRFSLNRLQLMMWTILIVSTLIGLVLSRINSDLTGALAIPAELLGLLGISAASATVSGAVKDSKDITRPEKIAGGAGFVNRPQVTAAASAAGVTLTPQKPSFVQVFLEEEGTLGQNRVVSVTKFQNFVFTLVLGVIYVVLTVKAADYASLDQQVLWLVGISHAGYVGGKLPNKD